MNIKCTVPGTTASKERERMPEASEYSLPYKSLITTGDNATRAPTVGNINSNTTRVTETSARCSEFGSSVTICETEGKIESRNTNGTVRRFSIGLAPAVYIPKA